ncbi:MAG: orotidine-5'-phosphate decarboxylase, partial [Firmicutes bacterium]|nr:orotidine-5'-phosphate decarboxylase [Bacillota bacterium]
AQLPGCARHPRRLPRLPGAVDGAHRPDAREAAAAEAFRLGLPKPKVVAVTVLTSLNVKALQEEVGIMESVTTRVLSWARLAQGCGLDGVVASPLEAAAVKKACGPDFTVITPGVRLRSQDTADQRRVTTPAEAVREGADYIVVGRPVIEAADPLRAAEEIVASLD